MLQWEVGASEEACLSPGPVSTVQLWTAHLTFPRVPPARPYISVGPSARVDTAARAGPYLADDVTSLWSPTPPRGPALVPPLLVWRAEVEWVRGGIAQVGRGPGPGVSAASIRGSAPSGRPVSLGHRAWPRSQGGESVGMRASLGRREAVPPARGGSVRRAEGPPSVRAAWDAGCPAARLPGHALPPAAAAPTATPSPGSPAPEEPAARDQRAGEGAEPQPWGQPIPGRKAAANHDAGVGGAQGGVEELPGVQGRRAAAGGSRGPRSEGGGAGRPRFPACTGPKPPNLGSRRSGGLLQRPTRP